MLDGGRFHQVNHLHIIRREKAGNAGTHDENINVWSEHTDQQADSHAKRVDDQEDLSAEPIGKSPVKRINSGGDIGRDGCDRHDADGRAVYFGRSVGIRNMKQVKNHIRFHDGVDV